MPYACRAVQDDQGEVWLNKNDLLHWLEDRLRRSGRPNPKASLADIIDTIRALQGQ